MTKDTHHTKMKALPSFGTACCVLTVRCILFSIRYNVHCVNRYIAPCQSNVGVRLVWLCVRSFSTLSLYLGFFCCRQHRDNVMMSEIMLANAYN